ncbi:MAG: Ppx/GppA phosphatase family protein [Bacilli bacterium]
MTLTGIIDIGSNSMRLSIIRQLENGGYYVVDEHKSSPRLSNHIDADGALSPAGVDELITHLREFQGLCAAYGVTDMLSLGTAALRAAANAPAIVETVREALGLDVDIISGEEEARLGYSAITHTLALNTAYLVDIGGGSTEVSLVEGGHLVASHSFPVGAVTLSRVWPRAVDAAKLLEMTAALSATFRGQPLLEAYQQVDLIGIGGTMRNIADIHQEQIGYPLPLTHNYAMTPSMVRDIVLQLAELPLARRKKVAGLSKDRADLIIPGGAILLALMNVIRTTRIRVSGRGLRDGAFYTRILGEPVVSGNRVLRDSVESTLLRFQESVAHASHRTSLALELFLGGAAADIVPRNADNIVYAAAMLHRIGVQVNYYHYDMHTFYLIVNSSLYGLSHRDIIMTAAAASFKNRNKLRKLCTPYRSILADDDVALAARLGVLVRLAGALDRRHEARVKSVRLDTDGRALYVYAPADTDADLELATAQSLAPLVKKVFNLNLMIAESAPEEPPRAERS